MILAPIEERPSLERLSSAATIARSHEDVRVLLLLVRQAGWGVILIATRSGGRYVVAVGDAASRPALMGDIRRWNREHGYTFILDSFDPDDRRMQIDEIYTLASGFTHWGVGKAGGLPPGYIRV